MKKTITMILLGLLAVAGSLFSSDESAVSSGSQVVKQLTTTAVEFRIPKVGVEVQRVVLDNGLTLFLYEDHRVPIVNVQLLVHCGAVYESLEKCGLSGMVGTVMRSGGSKNVPGDSLNNVLEYLGATLETDIGMESGSATLSVLPKDVNTGFELFADVIRNPAFPTDKLDLAKTEAKNRIKRRNDDLGSVGTRMFRNVMYGSHPYGRIQEWSEIKGITEADLRAYHARYFAPNNMMMAVSGDFSSGEVTQLITRLFGDWKRAEVGLPKALPVKASYSPGVFQVIKETNQTNVNIGALGVKRGNPDIPAIAVMNYILGGGSFASRITSRVRSDEGLSYRAGSAFETSTDDIGTFYGYCQTKSATTYKAVSIILDEFKKMNESGATDQEVKEAKESLINSYAFNFDTASKIVQSLMSLEFRGYPADYHQKYVAGLRGVTSTSVRAVAKKYLKPKQLAVVVIGNPRAFEKPLSAFGKVKDIELPPPDLK